MLRFSISLALGATLLLAGCESHEDKVADLQKEYDRLANKRLADCGAEITARAYDPLTHPNLSPRCADEDKQTIAAYQRLQAAQRSK